MNTHPINWQLLENLTGNHLLFFTRKYAEEVQNLYFLYENTNRELRIALDKLQKLEKENKELLEIKNEYINKFIQIKEVLKDKQATNKLTPTI